MSATPAPSDQPSVRAILRVVCTVVLSVLALYVVYLVRTPLTWLVIAMFVAVAASGPVNLLSRRLPRGAAIAIVYIGIVLTPIVIAGILLPPAVEQGVKLARDLPDYVQDLNKTVNENEQLKELNEKYDLTQKLDDLADDLVSDLGNAAGALADIGATLVSSIFALVTILVMSMFMVARGGPGARPSCRYDHPTRPSGSVAQPIGSPRPWAATWAGRWHKPRSRASRRS